MTKIWKAILGTWLCLVPFSLVAENVEHEHILQINYGGTWQQDQYLSPLLYKGMEVGIGGEWWQPFQQESILGRQGKLENWGHIGRVNIHFGWMYSSAKSNIIYAPHIQTGWGAYYKWTIEKARLSFVLGPYIELDYLARIHANSVNKPYSMDAGIHAMVMAGMRWCWNGKKTSYRLQYLLRTNLIGVDFMPDYWQSYYELAEGVTGKVRCAGMWNHREWNHELSLDMQFPHSTWRVGIRHEYLEYGEKGMMFGRESVEAIVGTCFRYKIDAKHKLTE